MIDIQRLENDMKDVQRKLEQLVITQDDSCFVIGLTGSAKSALISYLAGANINSIRKSGKYSMTHNRSDLPVIGNTSESCTDIPCLYKLSGDNLFLYDSPGFMETRGVKQEILNSYCNSQMFKLGSKAKIVIMVELHSLYSVKGGSLIEIAKRLHQLFRGEFRQILNSCLLVVSKVNLQEYTLQDLVDQIKQVSEQNKNIEPEGLMLFRTLLQTKRIIVFPNPNFINNNTISKIKDQIKRLPTFRVSQQPRTSLSSEAKNCIEEVVKYCERQKSELSYQIGAQIITSFTSQGQNKDLISNKLLNLRTAKQMLLNKQIQSGLPDKLQNFQSLLSLPDNSIQGMKQWMNQIKFCLTVHPQLRVSSKISEILLLHITQSQQNLENILQHITSREQMEAINVAHRQEIVQERERFNNQLLQMRRVTDQQKHEQIQRADRQRKDFLARMEQMNAQHARQMAQLNRQIQAYQSRQNDSSSGFCQVM